MVKKGVTREVFKWGFGVLGLLTLMLGVSLFVPWVDIGKMGVIAGFITTSAGVLGATKVSARNVEAKEALASGVSE